MTKQLVKDGCSATGNVWQVARFSLLEARRRRVLAALVVLSVLFVALFAVGFALVQDRAADAADGDAHLGPWLGALQTVLGLYAVHFLGGFLALLLGVGTVAPEVDGGTLHAVLARPLARWQYLAGRFAAQALLVGGYVLAMGGALFLIARVVTGYHPVGAGRVLGLLVLEVLVVLAAATLASTLLPALAGGVAVVAAYGVAWLAGIVGWIGATVQPPRSGLVDVATAVGLLFPSDAVWRAASSYAIPPLAQLGMDATTAAIPFATFAPPSGAMLAWAAAYPVACLAVAVAAFERRDF